MTNKTPDPIDVIGQFLLDWRRFDFEAPTTINLASPDAGHRLLEAIRQSPVSTRYLGDPSFGRPVEMADGSVYMEIEINGLKIRWPANKYATPDGTWGWA